MEYCGEGNLADRIKAQGGAAQFSTKQACQAYFASFVNLPVYASNIL